jgi:hypothetical protein
VSSPLDRIEARAMTVQWHADNLGWRADDEARMLVHDVLALVNVAKAAEPIAESVPRGLAVGKDELWALVEAYEALAKEPA